jgi:hypothetical protein
MEPAVAPLALVVAGLNAVAAMIGALQWSRGSTPARAFWIAVRTGQGAAVLFAALCGVLALSGSKPSDSLFWLYVVLPLVVALIAEQLRIAAAQAELDARELPDAQAMRALTDAEQRAIVVAILRREMLVMAVACAAVSFLALRAAMTA